MQQEHASSPAHLLVLGGDQVYADPVWSACPTMYERKEGRKEREERKDAFSRYILFFRSYNWQFQVAGDRAWQIDHYARMMVRKKCLIFVSFSFFLPFFLFPSFLPGRSKCSHRREEMDTSLHNASGEGGECVLHEAVSALIFSSVILVLFLHFHFVSSQFLSFVDTHRAGRSQRPR